MIRYENADHTRIHGGFRVFLDIWHLGDQGGGSDSYARAAVIGHEMLRCR